MRVLITGCNGFIGKNIAAHLTTLKHEVIPFDHSSDITDLDSITKNCEAVVHLAGVNRATEVSEFYKGNVEVTKTLCDYLIKNANTCPIIVSSSIQAGLDNDYGKSKKSAEAIALELGKSNGNKIYIFRLKNIYGKWSKPNYNSVIATWCHNVARDLPIKVDNPATILELCYIDDVVSAITKKLNSKAVSGYYNVRPVDTICLKDLFEIIVSFKNSRENYSYPNQSKRIFKNLYSTYLSYLPIDRFSYKLTTHSDQRGAFTEFIKSKHNGQISINVSKPGVTKGQHWHSSKNEKFMVVAGEGIIQLRNLFSADIIEYKVSSQSLEVVDIPPGYVHNIINSGKNDMVTVMWASELFNPDKPDTNSMLV